MNPKLDFHESAKKLASFIKNIESDNRLSEQNRKIILEYDRIRQLHGAAFMTRNRTLGCLRDLALALGDRPVEKATKADLQAFLLAIEQKEDYSVWTKSKYRGVIKKFYRWVILGEERMDRNDDNPEQVRWIKVHVKKKDIPKVNRSDILTDDEIKAIIEAAHHPRDRALLAVGLDIGCRPGELGNLSVGDVYRDEYSFVLHLRGKTGERDVETFFSDAYLARWLNEHPNREDQTAPLWPRLGNGAKPNRQLSYEIIRKIFKTACARAGIQKRTRLYIARHTRFTENLAKGIMNEAQAKVYGGLTMDSKMLANYAHLVSKDANDRLRELKGVPVEHKSEEVVKPAVCQVCGTANAPGANFCDRCGRAVTVAGRLSYRHLKAESYQWMDRLMQDDEVRALVEKKMARMAGSQPH